MTTALQTVNSYSQLCEDIFVFNNFLNVPSSDIVCVEIGAFDGLSYSNTLLFEEKCNANCILVEPSPINARKIRKNRPKAILHQVAVSEELGTAEFVGDSAVSGLSEFMEPAYMDRWNMHENRKYPVITVPTSLLFNVCELSYIDFLSIDVQGAELHVLTAMDMDLPIGIIAIELEGHHSDEDARCREILTNSGFVFAGKLKITEIWHNPAYERAKQIFDPDRSIPMSRFSLKDYAKKHLEQLQPALDAGVQH